MSLVTSNSSLLVKNNALAIEKRCCCGGLRYIYGGGSLCCDTNLMPDTLYLSFKNGFGSDLQTAKLIRGPDIGLLPIIYIAEDARSGDPIWSIFCNTLYDGFNSFIFDSNGVVSPLFRIPVIQCDPFLAILIYGFDFYIIVSPDAPE